ncbi:MAG: pyridoxal phosphate-dependent aminotransferase [Candidatus Marinimicrobia bacterium]|nr:pyridoxal phosphate-dependent aminotransferase [Candidatus Neomarinimicrobiota bacterium]MCF7839667.1 pyridoxal phosphate-dependent aminotransferase [Candidatus Neomarinimicrobiota bacterium]
MKITFTDRINRLKPSATMAVIDRAARLRAEGVNVISFGAGEPDFDTPDSVIKAAEQAMRNGKTRYTPGSGTAELKKAIVEKLARDNNLGYSPNQIIASSGAKHSLFNICQALFQEGDEVIVFSPYWVSFPAFVTMSGATPVFVQTTAEEQFQINAEKLSAAITPRTRGMIVNTPSNPTGGVLLPETLQMLVDMANQHDLWLISDECYEAITYDEPHISLATLPHAYERTLTVQSCSKTYAMTGWRIGYVAGNKDVVAAMGKFQGQSTSCPNSIAQAAAVEALMGDQTIVQERRDEFRIRRDYIIDALNQIPGLECVMPEGAFYAFPNISAYYGKSTGDQIIENSLDLAAYLIDEAAVATIPGAAFGADDYLRISYANSMEEIEEGVKRIKNALAKLT